MKKSDRHQAESDLFGTTPNGSDATTAIKFDGTDNPRYLRAIRALLVRPLPREHLDRVAGCSNGPQLVAELRGLGLGVAGLPCTLVADTDRDGRSIKRGVYSLTDAGRRAIHAWLRRRDKGSK